MGSHSVGTHWMYTLSNKNPSAWNFLSPEPDVTCGTVAIIIRVVLLSPCWRTRCVSLSSIHYNQSHPIYRVFQEECEILREGVPCVELYRYNPKHLYPKLNGYGDNGQRSLKLWQLLRTYWLPNTYWNWQEYVVSVMLISVLNIKVTCEW